MGKRARDQLDPRSQRRPRKVPLCRHIPTLPLAVSLDIPFSMIRVLTIAVPTRMRQLIICIH